MKKLFLSLAFLLPMMGTMAQTQVKTVEGILEGKDLSGIKVFKGVPFAAPPVGNLRWKAPQPAKHWDGVREAKEYGPNPMQEPLFGDMNFGTKVNSEDCLYLNIWTPAKTMKEHLPVLIYFNGGGLMAGSGSEARYAGDAMATEPLEPMACAKRPWQRGEAIRALTDIEPADSPTIVMRLGSPPKASILSFTHFMAATWSMKP